MTTIDTAKLADVTGGVVQTPKPVAPPQPSPTFPTPANSAIFESLRGAAAAGAATRTGPWTWGQPNNSDSN
jgi:hypothetical protein